ncbi:sterol O-acyltransferase 1-like [Panonychus citri]|uniref:sterol O-acyltransferase 1-like n=1 Tax=Panonychus citri TaxID=50023 RepID=UPI00230828C2|nr:sterol O-acyltransferase 1-like [Panonychus citri]XP_053205577.1 sterol O-acyltransferase 1-like [Panonychus citri]
MGSDKSYVHCFKERESILTDIFKTNIHIKSAYNLIISLFILFSFTRLQHYLLNYNELTEDLFYMQWAFGKLHLGLTVMSYLFVCSIFQWIIVRKIHKMSITFWITESMLILMFTVIPVILINRIQFSPILSLAIYLEQIRNAMKMWSLVVENMEIPSGSRATFKQFCYFMFAPTLIYRPSYPRSKTRSWNKVLFLFLQFLASIFAVFAIARRFVVNNFSSTGIVPLKINELPVIISTALVCGLIVKFNVMYGFLHSWLNMWAEMLQFADRHFYDAWWLSSSYGEYYRKWNAVVHVWLHTYIYNPLNKKYDNRSLAASSTMIISSLFHEYALALGFGFFYPVLTLMYFNGVYLYFATIRFSGKTNSVMNISIFASLIVGVALQTMLIPMEWYSRINCRPVYKDFLLDFIVPRTPFCVRFE